jgi:hypothetical protein
MAKGVERIQDLLSIRDCDIEVLIYNRSDTETNVPVLMADMNKLRAFKSYVDYARGNGNTLTNGNYWEALTQEDFDHFRVLFYKPSQSGATIMPASTPTTANAVPVQPTPKNPAELFRQGIKRDPTLLPTLKEEKFNDTWHHSFATQACAQNVMEVLDPKYVPKTTEEEELFDEKQKYVYAVLEQKILTDRGKGFVRNHEADYNARKVYQKLVKYHLRSTKALIDLSFILSYITSVRHGNGMWKGTTEGFIVHWENQVRLYERQVDKEDYFSDVQKRTMLENTVAPIDELRQIKSNADLEKIKTGRALTFNEYSSLHLSAAVTYDEAYKPKLAKRLAYAHDLNDAPDDFDTDDPKDYGIDVSVHELQAYAHSRMSRPRPNQSGREKDQHTCMPFDNWSKLSTEERALWDQLGKMAKTTILNSSAPKTGQTSASTNKRHMNLHEISVYDYLHANIHETAQDSTDNDLDQYHEANETEGQDIDHDSTLLVNSTTSHITVTPGNIRRVMSSVKRYQGSGDSKKTTRDVKMHVTYVVLAHRSTAQHSLVDRGSNGGDAGNDVWVISKSHRKVDIRGIDNHQLNDVAIGTDGGYVETQKGPIIAAFHQYALFGKGTSIHSPGQFEYYKNDVNDKSVHVGGLQRIKTLDGYTIPLNIKNGLARMELRPYTNKEWDTLPHVFLTGELDWDPSVLDHNVTDDEQWYDAITDLETDPTTNLFDEYGNYRQRVVAQYTNGTKTDACVETHENDVTDATEDEIPTDKAGMTANSTPRDVSKKDPDYNFLRPKFGWLPTEIIKDTFSKTTRYARLPTGTHLKRAFKSGNPALNVHCRNESVACDYVYADTPAIDDGATAAVLFVGTETLVTDIYGVKNDRQFVNTLEDNIRQRGAPNKLISDRAQVEVSNKVLDILRPFFISAWQSKPHQQQQNPAERRIQIIMNTSNRIMDRVGAPAHTWLLCLLYVCYLLNHTYNESIKDVLLNRLTGTTVDISPLLRFHFWQKVYYKREENTFPSESKEGVGHIFGISEHVGPMMTWKVLTIDTQKVLYRSQIRPFSTQDMNLRAGLIKGEDDPITKNKISKIIKS